MKKHFSARGGILLLLTVFGLLIAASTLLAVRLARDVSLVRQYDALMDDLKIIAGEVSEKLDDDDADPYAFLEVTARIQKDERHFSYILREQDGTILAPSFMLDRELKMKDIHMLRKDNTAFVAHVWGVECFVVRYAFEDHPLELLGIYDDQYVFGDLDYAIHLFVGILLGLFLLILLLAWFWIIPALSRVLEKKQRAEEELMVARDLQQKAVTKTFPRDDRCEVSALLQPARTVGGDIYRCLLSDNKLFFAVGDVSDKGMAAAYVMFLLSSVIQSQADAHLSLTALAGEINRLLLDNPEYEMFCTLFLGTIDLDTREFEYCNAGHTKTVVNGRFLPQDPQLIAGVVRDFPYKTEKMMLPPGSRLLLYTDGVTENRNTGGAFFGEQRLLEWVAAQDPADSCEKTCTRLLAALDDFRGKAQQNDDIAIMCIKIL